MDSFLQIIKYVPALIAALLLGNWFMAEARKAKAARKPWYAAYLTAPGILILLALTLPILVKLFLG